MFNVTRRDMGEFVFFMSQAAAITAEDLVQWLWKRYSSSHKDEILDARSRSRLGYAWVFIWFSISLPVYVKGCRDAGIVQDVVLESRPFDLGVELAYWAWRAL